MLDAGVTCTRQRKDGQSSAGGRATNKVVDARTWLFQHRHSCCSQSVVDDAGWDMYNRCLEECNAAAGYGVVGVVDSCGGQGV